MSPRAWIGAIVVALVAAFGVYQVRNTPERQIRSVLDEVAGAMTHEKPESGLMAAAAATSLQAYLAPRITVDTGRPLGVLTGSQDVAAAAARLRVVTEMMRVEFVDVEVSVTGGTSATVHATVKITTQRGSDGEVVDARELIASFTQLQGRWVVDSVQQLPVLEPVT